MGCWNATARVRYVRVPIEVSYEVQWAEMEIPLKKCKLLWEIHMFVHFYNPTFLSDKLKTNMGLSISQFKQVSIEGQQTITNFCGR